MPALQIDSPVLGATGEIVVSLPPNFPLSANRFRLGLYEQGRPARVADTRREFQLKNGRLQTSLRIEADPGAYDLRIISDNKERTPITASAPLLVPGIERDPGWWLVNGTPFLESVAPDNAAASVNAAPGPLFIAGLQRDLDRGQKNFSPIRLQNGATLPWNVLRLPALNDSLDRIDIVAFRNQVATALKERQTTGARNLFGILLPAPALAATASQSATSMRQLRQVVREAVPDAAFFLEFEVQGLYEVFKTEIAARRIGALASFADAVVIRVASAAADRQWGNWFAEVTKNYTIEASTWPIKAARRVAEEQPNFDLPIFLQLSSDESSYSKVQLLDYWMGGVSGFIANGAVQVPDSTPKVASPDWRPLVLRNLPLFAGSVTLEDGGLLPPPVDGDWGERVSSTQQDIGVMKGAGGGSMSGSIRRGEHYQAPTVMQYEDLRAIGRLPLLARLANRDSRGESFMVHLDRNATEESLNSLLETARGGARIYIEGVPLRDRKNNAISPEIWAKLTGATISEINNRDWKEQLVTLDDSWTFGTAQGLRIRVQRTVEIKLNATAATQARKPEKGLAVLTEPRVLARFEDGSPALIVNPVGRGEVIWMPDPPPYPITKRMYIRGAQGRRGNKRGNAEELANEVSTLRQYYTAIAAYVQPALVELGPVPGSASDTVDLSRIRVALRRSLKGTLLLAVMNVENDASAAPKTFEVSLLSPANVALDLATETELPLEKRGLKTRFAVTVPPQGWKLIAFGENRDKLDDERNSPRLKAKLK